MKLKRKILWLTMLVPLISIPAMTIFSPLNNEENQKQVSNNITSRTIDNKTIDQSLANLYSSEIATQLNDLIKISNPGQDQSELKNYLKKLFPNEMASLKPDAIIKNIIVRADSNLGSLYVSFGAFDGPVDNLKMIGQYSNQFILDKKGVTKVELTKYNDTTNTFEDIQQKLNAKDINYLVESGILPVIATNSRISSLELGPIDQNAKTITISRLVVENAVGEKVLTQYIYDGSTNPIVITNRPDSIKTTSLTAKFDYLNDPSFALCTTAEKFAQYLNDNKMTIEDPTLLLVKIINPTPDPWGTNVKIKEAIVKGQDKVEVTYIVHNYYNEYGVEITEEQTEMKVIYSSFPINKLITTINFENPLDEPNKDFAYQYTKEDIQGIVDKDIREKTNKIVINPADNTTAELSPLTYNNRTGTITTNITLNNLYNENGEIIPTRTFYNVIFTTKQTVNGPTFVERNSIPVNETINQIDAMSDVNKKEWAKKYISIVNGSINPNTEMVIESVVKKPTSNIYTTSQIEKSAIYEAKVSLTNYFINNETFDFNSTSSGPIFSVEINAKMNLITKVIDSVQASGIQATDPISKITVEEILSNASNEQKTTEQWIFDNSNKIFENYTKPTIGPEDIIGDIGYEKDPSSPTSLKVTLTLRDAITFTGYEDTTFTFIITNLQQEQNLTVAKSEIDVSGNKIEGINSDWFTLDIYRDKDNLKQKITNAINNTNNLDKFFDYPPSLEQIKDENGEARPIIEKVSSFGWDYDNTTLYIDAYFLANTQKNPNKKAEYKRMKLNLVNFNGNNTSLVKNEIDISSDNKLGQLTYNEVNASHVGEFVKKHQNQLFLNLPLSNRLEGNINISSRDDVRKSITVNITIIDAKVDFNSEGSYRGFGKKTFELTLVGFVQEAIQIKGKTLNINEAIAAGLTDLTPETYSIDFEDKFKSVLKDVLYENMDKWFDNTISGNISLKDKVNRDNFININHLNISYSYNTVIINGRFLGWNTSLNPHKDPEEVATSITIVGFNETVTTKISPVDISDDPKLSNFSVNDDGVIKALEAYINTNKGKVFQNFPEKLSIVTVGKIISDVRKGEITVSINVNNAMIENAGNKNYGSITFEVKFIGFLLKVEPTSGKSVSISEIGIANLDTSDYAFDFETDFKTAFINSIKQNPEIWLNNVPDKSKIDESSLGIVDESSLKFTPELDKFGRPILKITGLFISWNPSNNFKDPLVHRELTIIITGFNNANTTVNGSINIDNSAIPGLIDNEISVDDAAKKLNTEKEAVKVFLKGKIVEIEEKIVTGLPSTFDSTLNKAIDSGNFEFRVENGTLNLVINQVDQAIENGSVKKTTDLIIPISNKFNPIDLNTTIIKDTINWDEPIFKEIFGSDTSTFAFDWKNDFKNNSATKVFDSLKNYVENNKKTFFKISHYVNFDWTQKITITSVNTNAENDEFINGKNNLTCKLIINYKGYVKGTLIETNSIIKINLKAIPTENEILKAIQKTLNDNFSGNNVITKENFEQYINEHNEEIKNAIITTIESIMPKNIVVEFPPILEDIFELSKDNDGNYCVSLKPNSITIKPNTNVNSELVPQFGENGQFIIPKSTNQLIIKSFIPSTWWNDWIIYVIISSTVVLLLIIILVYELYLRKARRKSEINIT